MQIYIDGQFYSEGDAKISVFDHGLLYGDGVFEGIRTYGGRVFELDPHIDRLYASAQTLALEIPISRDELIEAMMECVRRNEAYDGYIRLVVTRGKGDLGLNPKKCPKATVFCIAGGITLYPAEVYQKGFKIKTLATRRNDPQAVNPAVKSLNYLNNVLGALELRGTDVDEGLFLTTSGYVCECTADNFFLIKGRKLMTPSTALGALGGITRGVVMRLAAAMGMEVEEGFYTLHDVYNADEAFLTGTAAEVGPVVEVDRRPIGAGVPGPTTKDIIARFHEYAQNTGTPVGAR
jgi:branched-chain amino acid aminotransferase